MPYKVTWLEQTVIVDFQDHISLQELRDHSEEVCGDPRFNNLKKRIFNCDKIESIDADPVDLKILAYSDKAQVQRNPDAHIAIVTSNDIIRGNTDCYRSALGPNTWSIEIFPTIARALAWKPAYESVPTLDHEPA